MSRRNTLLTLGLIIGLSLVSLALFILFTDINHYKPRVEEAASKALGAAVRIEGGMEFFLTPYPGASIERVTFTSDSSLLGRAEKISVRCELLPLLWRELKMREISVIRPDIRIERDERGRLNFENLLEKLEAEFPPSASLLQKVVVTKGALTYLDKGSGSAGELREFTLTLGNISFGRDGEAPSLDNIAFQGSLSGREMRLKDLDIQQISFGVTLGGESLTLSNMEVAGLRLTIQRQKAGEFNVEALWREAMGLLPRGALSVQDMSLTQGAVWYSDAQSNATLKAEGCVSTLRRLSFVKEKITGSSESLSVDGGVHCQDVRIQDVKVSNVVLTLKGENGKYVIEPLTVDVFSGRGEGTFVLDATGPARSITAAGRVSNFRLEEFSKVFSQGKVGKGALDASFNLSMTGRDPAALKRSLTGTFLLKGENLTEYVIDVDRFIEKYKETQTLRPADLGALLFIGPLGMALTRGYSIASMVQEGQGGTGTIRRLVSDWRIEKGIAYARDVAFTTDKNRVALKGGLDLVRRRFEQTTVAVLDSKGCAQYSQRVRGTIEKPEFEKPLVIRTILGPLFSLVEQSRKLLDEGRCEVFYKGALAHPR